MENKRCNVADFGAVGDGKTKNTQAIQKAIDTCWSAGGGTVTIRDGIFLSGTIRLKGKILLANCTVVYQEGNRELHPQWNRRILERNAAISEIAGENNFPVDDLYQVSLKIPKEDRREDGTHYEAAGYEILAEHVYAFVKTILENEDISAGE